MANIELPEAVAKKYKVAPKMAATFYHCGLGIAIDLTKVKMDMADKLAALKHPVLIAKKKKEQE